MNRTCFFFLCALALTLAGCFPLDVEQGASMADDASRDAVIVTFDAQTQVANMAAAASIAHSADHTSMLISTIPSEAGCGVAKMGDFVLNSGPLPLLQRRQLP
ncbi:MAG: hypothetical protein CO108_06360 [Deltaproteobacteria bacterium CG_4_9_14_3_um_filter_63_12]|nr:MAG: hypothetical protein CO108_06360 [Deltaproteobacteria bacterium CG_4_9_14_3_um_filter_63_12]